MKQITLIRHAESGYGIGLSDIDRALNERGEQAASLMADVLNQQQLQFDRVFSSVAKRALSTSLLLCKGLGYSEQQIIPEKKLYTFDIDPLYRFIEELDEELNHVAIICHNPAITQLAKDLTRNHTVNGVPTCGVLCIELNIEHWLEVQPGSGKLLQFDYPQKYLPRA